MQMNRYVFRSGRQADSQTYVENACFFRTLALHECACRGPNTTDTQHALVIMHEREKCVCVCVGGGKDRDTAGEATKFYVSHSICCVEKINKCAAIKFVVFMAFMLI